MVPAPRWTGVALAAAFAGSVALAQTTERVSVDSAGAQANGNSYWYDGVSISADNRFVAFGSDASNLVAGDTNLQKDVFVFDRRTRTTERVSIGLGGAQPDGRSTEPSISADGRFVSFCSLATNLVAGDTNGHWDVFVRDRQNGTTERVSVASGGAQGNFDSTSSSISADGRRVAFVSDAMNLVPNDLSSELDIFVRDRQNGTTEMVNLSSLGAQGNGTNRRPHISADGRFVVFESTANNLVYPDSNGVYDIFVRDLQFGLLERISLASNGMPGEDWSEEPAISADGRFVAFTSKASNLVPGDTNTGTDIFVRDRENQTTECASRNFMGGPANGWSQSPSISADGRCVSFASTSSDLAPGDMNWDSDVFLRDRASGALERVSMDTGGTPANSESIVSWLSADARFVAFFSLATNLVAGDTNAASDVFLRDRRASGFSSLCAPGLAGVLPCPCSNPPAGPGRGCDNSALTGGAVLSAEGLAYLAQDSLVFTASDERPTATSILVQGSAELSSGAVFGQGVRCAGGTLRRLYVKVASGGVIHAPDFAAGDAAVSLRSAALGDTIQAGESRFYFVYYRDPNVLGGCPSASTFNATQTGRVDWWL
jgi:Tol biopolymer transport system component